MNAARYSGSGCCADWRDRPENSAALCSMVIWLYSAFRGVQLTYEHTIFSSILRRLRPVILWLVSRNAAAG